MNKTIWKFPLIVTTWQNITMPIGAEILTVQIQNEEPCLWALVNPKAETESRRIGMFGTGTSVSYDMRASRKYISTLQMKNGLFVLHVFEYTDV